MGMSGSTSGLHDLRVGARDLRDGADGRLDVFVGVEGADAEPDGAVSVSDTSSPPSPS
jgi:hypothetical protein